MFVLKAIAAALGGLVIELVDFFRWSDRLDRNTPPPEPRWHRDPKDDLPGGFGL